MAAKSTAAADASDEPALYRVTEPSYVNEALREAGEVVRYDGIPGGNLEPINDTARSVVALSPKPGIGPGHPDFVRTLIARDKEGEPMGLPGGGVAKGSA